MSRDLVTQLLEYGECLRAEHEPIDLAEVMVGDASPDLSRIGFDGQSGPWRVRLRIAMFAAAMLLLLAGGLVWISRPGDPLRHIDDSPDTTSSTTNASTATTATASTTTTSTPATPDPAVSAPRVRVGPGAWTVAATLTDGDAVEETIADIVAEVRTWTGVIDVAVVAGASAWSDLIGLKSDCAEGETAPPCGPGIAVLTVDSSMGATALRLKSDLGMDALTAIDVPERFVTGYIDAAIEAASPVPLQFDPSRFGREQRLSGPLVGYEPEVSLCSGRCDVAVEVDIDGVVVAAGLSASPNGPPGFIGLGYNQQGNTQGSLYAIGDVLIDRAGNGGVLAELRASADGRRTYILAFLPLDAALIYFELADGSSVWQRPLAGMAVMVDRPGTGTPFGSEPPPVGPFIVLDASGQEIMRIEDTLDGPVVDDLRVDAETLSTPDASEENPGFTVEVVANVDTEVVTSGGESMTFAGHIVAADGVLWLHTPNSNGQSAVISLDTTTYAVGRIPIDGATGPLAASPGAIWVGSSDANGIGVVSRIDPASRAVTQRIEVAQVVGRPMDLLVEDGGLWVAGPQSGYVRIDLATFAVQLYPADLGQDVRWVGESNGSLWSYGGGQSLIRVDPKTGEITRFDVPSIGGPWGATLAGDAIWLASWDGALVRFDTVSGEVTDRLTLNHVVGWSGVFVDDAVWFVDATANVNEIDAATAELGAVIAVGGPNPYLATTHDGAVWVAHPDGAFSRIDIRIREVTDVVRPGVGALYSDTSADALWLVAPDGTISRIIPT